MKSFTIPADLGKDDPRAGGVTSRMRGLQKRRDMK
jgi:hypothetical protein